jgi:hypothetical protein
MTAFKATIKKFGQQGEKTGWTYIEIPAATAQKLKPGNKRSFRVKGLLDEVKFEKVALVPMGGGDFIFALNATIRKQLKKREGDEVLIKLEADESEIKPPVALIECMQDEPIALKHFYSLPKSHQHYFTRWIESAKTDATKTKRIAQTVSALSLCLGFSDMMKKMKKDKMDLNY